jgi:DNA-binding IclR family transcriptional regulator
MDTNLLKIAERQIGIDAPDLEMLRKFANDGQSFTLIEMVASTRSRRHTVERLIEKLVEYKFLSQEIRGEIRREGDAIAYRITRTGKTYLARQSN